MKELIEEHAKRLKFSWIRQHYHEVEAATQEEFLLKLLEKEIEQREERKLNLLINQIACRIYPAGNLIGMAFI